MPSTRIGPGSVGDKLREKIMVKQRRTSFDSSDSDYGSDWDSETVENLIGCEIKAQYPKTDDNRVDNGESSTKASESAMSRAFAIPELRDAILFVYGQQSQNQIGNISRERTPALGLFPVQRVSQTWSSAIRHSPQLRSLMSLDCPSGSTFVSPLRWFLRTLGMSFKYTQCTKDDNSGGAVHHYTIKTRFHRRSNRYHYRWCLPVHWTTQKVATWKMMPILREAEPNFGNDHLKAIQLTYEVNLGGVRTSEQTLSPEDNATLGDVYKRIQRVLLESHIDIQEAEQHRREVEAMIRGYALGDGGSLDDESDFRTSTDSSDESDEE